MFFKIRLLFWGGGKVGKESFTTLPGNRGTQWASGKNCVPKVRLTFYMRDDP